MNGATSFTVGFAMDNVTCSYITNSALICFNVYYSTAQWAQFPQVEAEITKILATVNPTGTCRNVLTQFLCSSNMLMFDPNNFDLPMCQQDCLTVQKECGNVYPLDCSSYSPKGHCYVSLPAPPSGSSSAPPASSNSSKTVGIVLGVLIPIIVISVVGFVVYRWKFAKKKEYELIQK